MNHFIKKKYIPLIVLLSVLWMSCGSNHEIAYITDAERDSAQAILHTYNTTIHPGDQLYIYIYSLTPEAVIPFNQETHTLAAEENRLNLVDTLNRTQTPLEEADVDKVNVTYGYVVDEDGFVTMPVLGKISVAGITQDSLQNKIARLLIDGGYIIDPVVTVSSMNFRVSVVGEVAYPHELHITGDRLTIFEALAMCGDLTMYGQRENVTVLREKNGVSTPITIDLTKKTLFDSEVYYLQKNDIVYVEPNKRKKKAAVEGDEWLSYSRFAVSLGTAIYSILRFDVRLIRYERN